MISGENSSGRNDHLDDVDAVPSRRQLVNGALYDAHLPTARLRNMAIAVAGRLMAHRTTFTAEQAGASRFLEVIFRSLERIDKGNTQASPALSMYGKPFETEPGVVDTGVLLLDANTQIREFEATDDILSPEAMGRHWIKNELADLHDHLMRPQTERVLVSQITPGEMPAIEQRQA